MMTGANLLGHADPGLMFALNAGKLCLLQGFDLGESIVEGRCTAGGHVGVRGKLGDGRAAGIATRDDRSRLDLAELAEALVAERLFRLEGLLRQLQQRCRQPDPV